MPVTFAEPRAAYLHVPFCRHRCGYCNFTLVAGRDDLVDDYLRAIADTEGDPDARFALRDVASYRPRPGDLICATRAGASIPAYNRIPDGTTMHCDLVVFNDGQTLESIGGNVRNSVSKTVRQLGPDGLLQRDRPWVLVVEDRYPDAVPTVASR